MSSRAQIVATIGPASAAEDKIAEMIENAMDLARINFSHGTPESSSAYIAAIRTAAKKAGKRVPIIMDLPGPRIQEKAGHSFDPTQISVITERDLEILEFGIEKALDYVAQSFVGNADDVRMMKKELEKRGSKTPIIAKIERRESVDAFDEILAVADAIMIARGDLGVAVPIEDVPFIERDLIMKCRNAGKPVITATEMLFSMVENVRPTRAEVTDVVYAIMLGSDAVMLSDETARGKYPAEAVATMEKIVVRAERERRHVKPNRLQ